MDVLIISFPHSFPPLCCSRSPSRFILFRTSNLFLFSFRCFHLCDPSLLSLPCSRFHFSLSACLIDIILVIYPYLSKSAEDPIYSVESNPPPLNERRNVPFHGKPVFWESKFNVRDVSLLFSFSPTLILISESDPHELVAPHVYHLRLAPQHLSSTSQRSSLTA